MEAGYEVMEGVEKVAGKVASANIAIFISPIACIDLLSRVIKATLAIARTWLRIDNGARHGLAPQESRFDF